MKERSGPRVFYGWIIVAVMTVLGGATMAMGGFNFGLFIKPMGDDIGMSRQAFGWAISLRSVAGAVTGPFMGRIVDRRGARLLLVVSISVTALGMVGLSFVHASWQVIALFIAMGSVGMVGPGAILLSVPVAKWFVQKRAMAFAIMSVGTPAGAVLFVPLTQVLIDRYDWRASWVILAIGAFLLCIPLALLVRRQPEDLGQLPDGLTTEEAAAHPGAAAALLEVSWTVKEATHNSAFWRLVGVFSLVMLAMSSVGLHRIPHFTDQGIDASLVSLATALDAVFATLSTFAMGRLFQRFPARIVGACGFLVLAVGIFLTIQSHSVAMMFISMSAFGIGAGGMIMLQNVLWADYFGRAHVGSIRGASMPMTLVFSAAGAPIAGLVQDRTGSYNPVWWVGIALMVAGAALLFGTPPPRRRSEAAATAEGPAQALPA